MAALLLGEESRPINQQIFIKPPGGLSKATPPHSRSKPSRLRRVCVDIAAVADVKDLHLGIVADDPVYDAVFADANAAEPSPMAM